MVELGSLDSSRKITLIHEKVSQINFVLYFMCEPFVFLREFLPNTAIEGAWVPCCDVDLSLVSSRMLGCWHVSNLPLPDILSGLFSVELIDGGNKHERQWISFGKIGKIIHEFLVKSQLHPRTFPQTKLVLKLLVFASVTSFVPFGRR